jgi:hypothetical protein
MNTFSRSGLLMGLASACALAPVAFAPAQTAVDKSNAEVQTRGPIHEAFAQPFDVAVQADPLVPKHPPPPVPEDPPDLKPDGAGVGWIPGYWAWDADANEFLWISGVYRNAPGGRSYVPGYWEQTADGWRWVHGFWAPADQPDINYVPPPPASVESGPSLPPPGDDYTYVPGIWVYRESRYVWRPGYYMQCRPGLVWIPACYVWTPAGCVYVSGYWDYPLERRGLLFAPVAFRRSPWQNPGWAWQPNYVVAAAPLLDSLFVDTRFHHYRYGDFYGKRYLDRGIQPWYIAGTKNFDPLYAYYRVANRKNAGWQSGLVTTYNNRLSGKTALPARSLGQQTTTVGPANNGSLKMVQPLARLTDPSVKLTRATAAQLTQSKAAGARLLAASQVRLKTEAGRARQTSRITNLDAQRPSQPTPLTQASKPATVVKTPLPEPKPVKVEAKHQPTVQEHKQEIKHTDPPLKEHSHDVKAVHPAPKAEYANKSAGTVKTSGPAPHPAHTPPAPQAHASKPKPPPPAHGGASTAKKYGN